MILSVDGYNVHIETTDDDTISLDIYNGFNNVKLSMTPCEASYVAAYLDVLAGFVKRHQSPTYHEKETTEHGQ